MLDRPMAVSATARLTASCEMRAHEDRGRSGCLTCYVLATSFHLASVDDSTWAGEGVVLPPDNTPESQHGREEDSRPNLQRRFLPSLDSPLSGPG